LREVGSNTHKYKQPRERTKHPFFRAHKCSFISILIDMFYVTILAATVFAVNFDWERDQLTETEVLTNSAIHFGSLNATAQDGCRNMPGDPAWPSASAWRAFNDTLGGVLLQPKPLGSVCYFGSGYNAQRCSQLQQSWTNGNLQYLPSPF
jgi:hypothetical protein